MKKGEDTDQLAFDEAYWSEGSTMFSWGYTILKKLQPRIKSNMVYNSQNHVYLYLFRQ